MGYYGVGNLGDDTVVAILIKKIRERYPNVELSDFSLRPADTERRHGIKAFPILRRCEVSPPRGEPPLARTNLKPTLYIELKQLVKKCRKRSRVGKLHVVYRPMSAFPGCFSECGASGLYSVNTLYSRYSIPTGMNPHNLICDVH